MVKAKSVEVDGVAGATYTSNALLAAAKSAYEKAMGSTTTAKAVMKPGTYTGKGIGYFLGEKVAVDVTVSADKITGIVVSLENGETKPILQSVIDKMLPRMIENQSVAVDSITGATVSSNAVRTAVTQALEAALVAGGSKAEAVSAFRKAPAKVKGVVKTISTDVLVVGMGGSEPCRPSGPRRP
jgi:fumarate reductase flavoprotein subunit